MQRSLYKKMYGVPIFRIDDGIDWKKTKKMTNKAVRRKGKVK